MSQHRASIPSRRRFGPAFAVAALTLVLAFNAAPLPAEAAPPRGADAAAGTVGKAAAQGLPSIQYLQAMEHAGDRNAFTPGGRVTVPYRPRLGDATLVDGRAPVALPAGRASGAEMAASVQGSVWAPAPATVPSASDGTSDAAGTTGTTGGSAAIELTSFTAPAAPTAVTPAASANTLRREVYGFLPYWELGVSLNYDVLSTIAYFGVGVDSKGNLIKKNGDGSVSTGWAGWTSSSMTSVIQAAHARGTRVTLTIESFAWSDSQAATQTAMLSSSTARLAAAQQTAAAVRDRGADGVNVDFEPIATGQKANFVSFIRTLRAELSKINAGYSLTFDTTGYVDNYDAAALTASGAADALFIMGYDFRTAGAGTAGSIAPLTSPTVYDLTNAVNAYRALVPANKIILGLPYYGRAWTTTSTAANAKTINDGCSATPSYSQAADLAETNGRHYDAIEQSAWTTYRNDCGQRELYYDDAQSLGAKYDMVNYWGLRGTGIWALGYDEGHTELNQVLASKFLSDKTPPKAGIQNLSATQTSEGFKVTWTGRDDWNGVKSYDVQVSVDGGLWTSWLTGTTATSGIYQGRSGHGYGFRVRATDTAGNVGAWDVAWNEYAASPELATGGFLRIQADLLNMRSAPTVSAAAVDQANAGETYQIIGGPMSADGYTWYQVSGPVLETCPVTPVFPGPWIAATSGAETYAVAIAAPNTTFVAASIGSLTVGNSGLAASPTGIDRTKSFSPNGDGILDTMSLAWTNSGAFDSESLSIYRADGSLAGTVSLGARAGGRQLFTWDGKLGGTAVPNGRYLLQVNGKIGSTTYYAPSPAPFGAAQWAVAGVTVDATKSGTYYPLAPVRILDTRNGTGLSGAFKLRTARSFQVAGKNGVPANAMAVTGNLTVTNATAKGFLQLGPSVPGTSSTINFGAHDNRANGVTVGLASNGTLSAYLDGAPSGSTVDVVFDLTGYFVADSNGATFVPINPARLVDSRSKLGVAAPLTSGSVATFQVAGKPGIPSNATAITGNLTITSPTSKGYVFLAPSIRSGTVPGSSTINFPAADTRANNVTVPLSAGKLQVEFLGTSRATAQVIFDVTGYFVPGLSGGTFVPLAPGRVVDTRTPLGISGSIAQGAAPSFAVVGKAGVASVAFAAVGNLTVTGQTSRGWLAIAAAKATTTSTLNFPLGEVRANEFVAGLASNGSLTVTFGGGTSGAETDAVVDVVGYYR